MPFRERRRKRSVAGGLRNSGGIRRRCRKRPAKSRQSVELRSSEGYIGCVRGARSRAPEPERQLPLHACITNLTAWFAVVAPFRKVCYELRTQVALGHCGFEHMRRMEMRKILLASAAAICAGGVASAEVSLSGEGKLGLSYVKADAGAADTTVINSINVKFTLSGESDSMFGPYGGAFTLDGSKGEADQTPFVVFAGSPDGDIGKFQAGSDISAADRLYGGTGDPGLDGLGVDDIAEAYDGDSGASIRWDKSIADFTVAFSTDLDDGWAIGATAALGQFTVGGGYDQDAAKDNVVSFGVKSEISGVTANAYFSQESSGTAGVADKSAIGVEASFDMGDLGITVAYSTNDDNQDGYGVGVTQDLGGGLSMKAGFGNVNDTTKANAGLLMSF